MTVYRFSRQSNEGLISAMFKVSSVERGFTTAPPRLLLSYEHHKSGEWLPDLASLQDYEGQSLVCY